MNVTISYKRQKFNSSAISADIELVKSWMNFQASREKYNFWDFLSYRKFHIFVGFSEKWFSNFSVEPKLDLSAFIINSSYCKMFYIFGHFCPDSYDSYIWRWRNTHATLRIFLQLVPPPGVRGRTVPAVHRARTGAPLPKIGNLRPYYPYIAPLLTNYPWFYINIRHQMKPQVPLIESIRGCSQCPAPGNSILRVWCVPFHVWMFYFYMKNWIWYKKCIFPCMVPTLLVSMCRDGI